jgi:hypothetical protein
VLELVRDRLEVRQEVGCMSRYGRRGEFFGHLRALGYEDYFDVGVTGRASNRLDLNARLDLSILCTMAARGHEQ